MRETMRATFERSPEEALERTFTESHKRVAFGEVRAFMWQSMKSSVDSTTYGSYKDITKASLKGRKYRIEFWDGAVSIFWLDVVYDLKVRKAVPV